MLHVRIVHLYTHKGKQVSKSEDDWSARGSNFLQIHEKIAQLNLEVVGSMLSIHNNGDHTCLGRILQYRYFSCRASDIRYGFIVIYTEKRSRDGICISPVFWNMSFDKNSRKIQFFCVDNSELDPLHKKDMQTCGQWAWFDPTDEVQYSIDLTS